MTLLPDELFAGPPARDSRFNVVEVWSQMNNIYDDHGMMTREFLHRQMHEEVNGLEIAARNITDFPDVDWDLRMAIARQCWDEARHVDMFRQTFEERGGVVGEFPVLCFEFRILTQIRSLIGRLTVQNRSFEAAGIQAIREALDAAKASGEKDLEELFDTQLPDEIQHVRYANRWIKKLVERDPRQALEIVRAVGQANAAFTIVAGEAVIHMTLDDGIRSEAGFDDAPVAAASPR
jgi:uncharacterized ferritin-like protein (DUF455 family)